MTTQNKATLVEMYCANCQSPSSSKNAAHWLRNFAMWVKSIHHVEDIAQVQPEHVIGYKVYLTDRGLAASSVARCCEQLRSFFRWAHDQGMIDHDPAKALKSPRAVLGKEATYLEVSEIKALFTAIDFADKHAARDAAMLWVLTGCGLRASEVINLDVGSIIAPDGDKLGEVKVVGKRNYARRVPLNAAAYAAIQAYLAAERGNAGKDSPLFTCRWDGDTERRLTVGGFEKWFRVLCERAKVPPEKRHPHACRHSFITRLLFSSAVPGAIFVVSKLAGHSSISVTEKYLHADKSAMQVAILADPLTR